MKKPLFDKPVYVSRPNLPTEAELRPFIRRMLEKRWVTNFGDFHNELEKEIKELHKVKYCVLCCNGTMALFLLLRAMELKGKVATTAFTFPATVHAVHMAGLEPLFCDIESDTYTISPDSLRKNITADTSCILGVDVFGNLCDVEALEEIGRKKGIPVIYDAAHAFMCSYKGKPAGGFGKAEMFSFHATKLFTTIEGGAITTNDKELYLRLKQLINFGIKNEESVVGIGLNGKMPEINAIFGLLSLKKMDKILSKLERLCCLYRQRLSRIPGLKLQRLRPGCRSNNQYFTIEVIPEEFGLDRDELHEALKAENIISRKYFYPPAHRYECYWGFAFARKARLPYTELVSERILCLPVYATLAEEDVEKICAAIASARQKG